MHRQEIIEAEKLANEAARLLEDANIGGTALPEAQPVPIENQEPASTANMASNSGQTSPKNPESKRNSNQPSAKKVSSRKASASDGNNIKSEKTEGCSKTEKIGNLEEVTIEEGSKEQSI